MAALTLYMSNSTDPFVGSQLFVPTAPTTNPSSPNTGWTVAKVAASNYAQMTPGSEVGSAAFNSTVKPGSSFSSEVLISYLDSPIAPFNGTFDVGNWVLTCSMLAVTAASTQRGRARARFWKMPLRLGTATNTDLSGADQVGTTQAAAPTTTVPQSSVITWSPGTTITLSDEYLVIALAWEITTAGGSNSADQVFRLGSGDTRLVTPNFTEGPTRESIRGPMRNRGLSQAVQKAATWMKRDGLWIPARPSLWLPEGA